MIRLQKKIIGWSVTQAIVSRSKKIILPGFKGVPLYDVAVFFLAEVKKEGLNERAAAIAYNFIMAIPPTCLFLFTLVPSLPFVPTKTIQNQLHTLIHDIIPAKTHNENVINFVDSFFGDAKVGLLSFGFLLLVFFASNGMMGLMRSFNKISIGYSKRTGLQSRWMAIRLTFLIMGLLLGCLALLIMQGNVMTWLGIKNRFLVVFVSTFRWIFMFALIFFTFAFVYKYAPALKKRWNLVSPGSILGAILSVLATIGFSIFVNNFTRYNALYGSIGTVIVLMILIYINALVLLIGYELNASIHALKAMADERVSGDS
ncbi:MAG: YihY/virulence factor BrkB family protein [Chitinophagaceae bacterium]|nr:YihY/virulence factor BrkB family protein [Chitinophagaceae bacterium]